LKICRPGKISALALPPPNAATITPAAINIASKPANIFLIPSLSGPIFARGNPRQVNKKRPHIVFAKTRSDLHVHAAFYVAAVNGAAHKKRSHLILAI